MTHQKDYTLSASTIEELSRNGFEAIPEMVRVLLNSIMQAERAKYLQAGEYERSENRKGHANGYKPKTVRTRIGEITFSIPQVREGGFYPSALEKHGEIRLAEGVVEKLQRLSVSTVKRVLKRVGRSEEKLAYRKPKRSRSQRRKDAYPMRKIAWDIAEPGHFEVDLVHHCGESAVGEYISVTFSFEPTERFR
ncbi:MAG: hypothetical protein HPY45_09720 [Anaerolineae bacterium]|nr:hypothetical protein [Anaerolineae bacterium]